MLDAAAAAAYNPALQAAQKAAGGRSFRTTGTIVAVVGAAPKRVSISEWDSLEQARAWENSEARKNSSRSEKRQSKSFVSTSSNPQTKRFLGANRQRGATEAKKCANEAASVGGLFYFS